MAIRNFNESSLGSSEVFQGINNAGGEGKRVQDKAVELIKNAKQLKNEDIEAAYIAVKQSTDGLTRAAIKAYDDGRIVLIYNNVPTLSITQSLPFITFKTPRGYVTYVFMDKYVRISAREGVLHVEPAVLRDLLIGAVIANGLKRNYDNLSGNQYLQKVMCEIYCKFFTRILNREFAIASDKIVFDCIQYHVNRFFLEQIFGAADSPENIHTIASAHFKYIDEIKAAETKKAYEDAGMTKISDLLNLLKDLSPRMKTLNLGTFLSDWINYYYVASTLAVDNIEYLLFMTMGLLNGNTNIVNISASDIVKEAKNIKSLRGELLKLI